MKIRESTAYASYFDIDQREGKWDGNLLKKLVWNCLTREKLGPFPFTYWIFFSKNNSFTKQKFHQNTSQVVSICFHWRIKNIFYYYFIVFGTVRRSIFQISWFDLKIIFAYRILKSGFRSEIVLSSNIISHWEVSKRIFNKK
jgi:hypothetical protein